MCARMCVAYVHNHTVVAMLLSSVESCVVYETSLNSPDSGLLKKTVAIAATGGIESHGTGGLREQS